MSDSNDVDACGLLCPLPVLKARKRLAALPAGACLSIIADDPAAMIDMPHFCNEAGYELLEQQDLGTAQLYVIRKP